jgi:hypothetical protein
MSNDISDDQHDWMSAFTGVVTRYDVAASPPSDQPEGTQHRHPGQIDQLLGLNPDKSFTERAMEPFFGTPGDPGPLQIHEGDSDGMKLARAGGIVATLPIWGVAAVTGAALDHANHILGDFAEIGTGIANAPTQQAAMAGDPGGDGSAPEAPPPATSATSESEGSSEGSSDGGAGSFADQQTGETFDASSGEGE